MSSYKEVFTKTIYQPLFNEDETSIYIRTTCKEYEITFELFIYTEDEVESICSLYKGDKLIAENYGKLEYCLNWIMKYMIIEERKDNKKSG